MKNFFSNFLATILIIVFVINSFILVFLINSKDILTKTNISNIAKELDISEIELEGDYSISNYYVRNIDSVMEKDVINALINDEKANEIISSKVGEIIDYAINGGSIPQISEAEINSIIDYDKVEKELNIVLSEEQKEEIENYINNSTNNINEELRAELDTNYKDNYDDFELIRFIFSNKFKIVIIAIEIVIVLLLALCIHKIRKLFLWLGIPTTIMGFIFTVIGLWPISISNIINSTLKTDYNKFIEYISKNVFGHFLIDGIVILIFGIVLIIVSSILYKKHSKNKIEN